MDRLKNKKSIRTLFLKYIMVLCAGTILSLLVVLLIFFALDQIQLLRGASYNEQLIESRRDLFENMEDIEALVPQGCKYLLFDEEGKEIKGNIEGQQADAVWDAVQKESNEAAGRFIKVFYQKNGNVCVVLYKIQLSYSNPVMEKFLPSPLILLILLFLLFFAGLVIVLSKKFGRILFEEMERLNRATESILNEDLNFNTEVSEIKEIDKVLKSLSKLKSELNESLKQQWKTESEKREQVSALGHDLKTPLTILRGNAELMEETSLDNEQQIYCKNILHSAEEMQQYLRMLLDINRSQKNFELQIESTKLKPWMKDILYQTNFLALNKRIKIVQKSYQVPDKIDMDQAALTRAVMNILSNAVEYTPEDGKIVFSVIRVQDELCLRVEDSGKGFTQEELERAKEQFYQGDKSRRSKQHFGMGLSIAESIVLAHGGRLLLGNSKQLSGAMAELILKI